MTSGDGWGLSFPDICLRVEEKPQTGNTGLLGERQQYYPSTTAVVNNTPVSENGDIEELNVQQCPGC